MKTSSACTATLALGISSALWALSACVSPPPRVTTPAVDPDAARGEIERLLPAKIGNRSGWAVDIFAAFETLRVTPSTDHICAVLALAEQESGFQVDPVVPGLPALARREIEARAAGYGIPKLAVSAALQLRSPNGMSYSERLDAARSEKALNDLYEDFISSVPLGRRLFANLNPIRTAGPMQVSVAYAERHTKSRRYPYPLPASVRDEVFTRRGGLYFGIAHLFDYPADYDAMLFRFADYNAGHYASRNAAFQNAVNKLTKSSLLLDGDLLRHGDDADQPSQTELTLRRLATRLELSDAQIHRDLAKGDDEEFAGSTLYMRVFTLADRELTPRLARAVVPQIRLQSPKITRRLTTDWFAQRVDERYRGCLQRASSPSTSNR